MPNMTVGDTPDTIHMLNEMECGLWARQMLVMSLSCCYVCQLSYLGYMPPLPTITTPLRLQLAAVTDNHVVKKLAAVAYKSACQLAVVACQLAVVA